MSIFEMEGMQLPDPADDPYPLEPTTVQWNDPRWQQVGIKYHVLNHWTMKGYLHPDKTHPGSGVNRRWPVGEVEIAARMVRVVKAGFRPAQAAVIARASGPVELAPGVWVGLADLEEEATWPSL